MKPTNDTTRERVVITEHLDERDIPTRELVPEPEPVLHVCTFPGEELTDAEREALERFFAWQRAQARGKRAA